VIKGSYIDISGNRYGNLTAVSIDHRHGGRAIWLCVCDCGNKTTVSISNLRNGHTQSCGCLVQKKLNEANRIHGEAGSRLYRVWKAMRQRCYLQSGKYYSDYGGRGIRVCCEWNDYETFRQWAYSSGYDPDAQRGKCTLDRIDVDGNYEPSNCRWVDMKVQANNRRNSKHRGLYTPAGI